MTEERRYGEREVAEILDRATDPSADLKALGGSQGLTLAEIQQIGAEAGISPDRIASAASSLVLHRESVPAQKTFMGIPKSVHHTGYIDRALTDEEWSRVVADLRATFQAHGQVESHGTLRSWTNGNLQVHIEPHGDRYRVRMQTLRSAANEAIAGGLAMSTSAGVMALLLAAGEITGAGLAVISAIAVLMLLSGIGLVARERMRLPQWIETRRAQMEGLAERIPLLLSDET